MTHFRELKIVLAITIIGLFAVAVFNALSIADAGSGAQAYRFAIISTLSFVWGLMVWLAYEDPVKSREIIMVTIVGLALLAVMEAGIVASGQASGFASSPVGPPILLEEALWSEASLLAGLAVLLFYFRPPNPQPPSMVE